MNNLLETFEKKQIERLTGKKRIPTFRPGDTLKVTIRITEGDKSRLQAFEGMCIARKNNSVNSNFTVRKLSHGEGVERVFPLFSPLVEKIDVVRKGDVRRAKLYYLRELSGKKARISERTDGRAYDDEQYVSTIEDVVEASAEQGEDTSSSDTPVVEEAPTEVVEETKTEASAPQEESKEEVTSEEKPEEAEAKT